MPQKYTSYPSVMSLVSLPRMDSFKTTFHPKTDAELYGVYVWAQHTVGALYPITQNVEISLRNAIDKEATRRFGKYWWRLPQFGKRTTQDFLGNLTRAEKNLKKHWIAKERIRLGLPANTPVPTPAPVFGHDQIIAATDFSTWEYVLRDDFSASHRAEHSTHLWPLSMSKVFRRFSIVHNLAPQARTAILDLVREIRIYRNRLFHHDRIWIMDPTVVDARTAIDTIRKKINRMETLIEAIEPQTLAIMSKVGIFSCARRVCSVRELDIYRYTHIEHPMTRRKKRVLRGVAAQVKAQNVTAAWKYGDSLYGLYKIR